MEQLNNNTARLSAQDLDAIRASVDWRALFDALGLKKVDQKSKPDDWWALSPFHEEKTASFHMTQNGGGGAVWYDFSIGEGGGAIELVQRLRNCNCYQAARFLLDQGLAESPSGSEASERVSKRNITTRNKVDHTIKGGASQQSQGASQSSSIALHDDRDANPAIRQDLIALCGEHEVLEQRGISEETCEALGIGYLAQGRSPLKGRIVFQVADARPNRKLKGQLDRVILSHIGRAVNEGQEPKYLFYEGFHKAQELYGQEILWLHEDAAEQMKCTGSIVLTEGPFDVAKAYEAGLRNVVASFGGHLSNAQANKLKAIADANGITSVIIVFDRDDAGRAGAAKAEELLTSMGLNPKIFDWEKPIGRPNSGAVHIPKSISDLAEFNSQQITWLRSRGLF